MVLIPARRALGASRSMVMGLILGQAALVSASRRTTWRPSLPLPPVTAIFMPLLIIAIAASHTLQSPSGAVRQTIALRGAGPPPTTPASGAGQEKTAMA